MLPKRKLLINSNLYLILDAQVRSYDELFKILKKALSAKVGIIQLRDKVGSAREILDISKRMEKIAGDEALFIINDRIDIAMAAQASGVHLGQEDMPFKEARRILGKNALIGISCQTFEQAKKAEFDGADYIGLGSVFKTFTKPGREPMDPNLFKKIIKNIMIPVFPIGGITLDNVGNLISTGATRVAVCRSVLESNDVKGTVTSFKKVLSKNNKRQAQITNKSQVSKIQNSNV